MRKYTEVLLKSLFTLGLVGGILYWFSALELKSGLMIFIAAAIVLLGVGSVAWNVIQKRKELQSGDPNEDEFTLQAKVFAGSKAFTYSMYLWFLIFIVHYLFPSAEAMLGTGVLGSAGLYGFWLWYFKSTGAFADEE